MNFSVPLSIHVGIFGWVFFNILILLFSMWSCRYGIKRSWILEELKHYEGKAHPSVYVPWIAASALGMILSSVTVVRLFDAITNSFIAN